MTSLARHMFNRRCELDGIEPDMVEEAWADPGVQGFWNAEADHVVKWFESGGPLHD